MERNTYWLGQIVIAVGVCAFEVCSEFSGWSILLGSASFRGKVIYFPQEKTFSEGTKSTSQLYTDVFHAWSAL